MSRERLMGVSRQPVVRATFPLVFLGLVTVLVFAGPLLTRTRTFYAFTDNVDQYYAWHQKLAAALHSGHLPFWDANLSAGHSFVAEFQTGVFYPINLLWVWVFGSSTGIDIGALELLIALHFWLASLGMYYAARQFGFSKPASLAAAVTFAFGGTVAMRSISQTAIFFSLSYLPWVFATYHKFALSGLRRYLIACGLAQAMMITAGHIQPWYHALLLLVLFIVLTSWNTSSGRLRLLLTRAAGLTLAALIAVVLALPQLILSARYLPLSYRFVGEAEPIELGQKVGFVTFTKTYSYKLENFLSLIDPVQYPVIDGNELYIGLLGLLLVVLLLTRGRSALPSSSIWRQYRWFLLGTVLVTSIIMIGHWTFVAATMRLIPLVSQIRELGRYSIMIHFCLCLLVALAIEIVPSRFENSFQSRNHRLWSALALILIGVNGLYLAFAASRGHIDKHLVYQIAVICFTLALALLVRRQLRFVLLSALVLSAATQPVWFLPRVDDHRDTYPPSYYRRTTAISFLEQHYGRSRVLIEDNALPVNIGDLYRIQTVNGYWATLQKEFFDFLNEPETEATRGIHLALLNVQFLVSKKEHPELVLQLHDRDREVYVYERPGYAPRAYFLDQEHACRSKMPACQPPAISTYSDHRLELDVATDRPRTLVLSEVNVRGWKAYIDGARVPIDSYGPLRVKLFRSIVVPPGRHHVVFRYEAF